MITTKKQTDITQNLEEENFSEIFEFFNNLNFNKFNVQKERFTNSPISIELFFNTKTNKVVFGGNTDDCIMKIELVIWNQKNIEDGKQTKLEIKFSEILADKNNAKLRNEFNQLILKSAKTKLLNRYKKEVKYLFDKPNHKIFWKDFVNKKNPINFLDKNSTMDLLCEHHYFAFSKAEEEKTSEVIKNYILDYWTESDFAILNKENKPILIIEYDGEQHFKSVDYFGGDATLQATQYRDSVKDEYCKENNIPFLRFNYKQSENDIEDLLLKLNKMLDKF